MFCNLIKCYVFYVYRLINEDMDNRIAKLKIVHADEEDGVKEEITQIEHDCVSVLKNEVFRSAWMLYQFISKLKYNKNHL